MKHVRKDHEGVQDLAAACRLARIVLSPRTQFDKAAAARLLAFEVLGLETKIRSNDKQLIQKELRTLMVPWDEPVFLVRAIDPMSGAVVQQWADLAKEAGTPYESLKAVYVHAHEMDTWPVKETPKLPEKGVGLKPPFRFSTPSYEVGCVDYSAWRVKKLPA